jgi:hypothetical protein
VACGGNEGGRADAEISAPDAGAMAVVVGAREDLEIARQGARRCSTFSANRVEVNSHESLKMTLGSDAGCGVTHPPMRIVR